MSIISLLEEAKLSPTLLEDRGEYIKAVRQGISGAILPEAIKELGERDLFIHVGIWGNSLDVVQQAVLVFGDGEIAKEWLHTSIPALSGELPINLCDTFEGRKIVKESLKAIEYGEFS